MDIVTLGSEITQIASQKFTYLVSHIVGHFDKSDAVGIVQICGEVESGRSQVSVVFLLLHAFAVDLGSASWTSASETADRVTAHEARVAGRYLLATLVDVWKGE